MQLYFTIQRRDCASQVSRSYQVKQHCSSISDQGYGSCPNFFEGSFNNIAQMFNGSFNMIIFFQIFGFLNFDLVSSLGSFNSYDNDYHQVWHDDVISLIAFQLLTYTQMPIPGWEAKPCPNFPRILLLACEFNGGGPVSWKWLVWLKNAF